MSDEKQTWGRTHIPRAGDRSDVEVRKRNISMYILSTRFKWQRSCRKFPHRCSAVDARFRVDKHVDDTDTRVFVLRNCACVNVFCCCSVTRGLQLRRRQWVIRLHKRWAASTVHRQARGACSDHQCRRAMLSEVQRCG